MALFKRAGVWYTRIKVDGAWIARSTNCTDRRAAESVHTERQREASNPSAHKATIADAIADFLAAEQVQARAEGTQRMYDQKSRHIERVMCGILGLVYLRDVDAQVVDNYCRTRLAEGAKRTTIDKELTTLRGTLRLALRNETYTRPLESVLPKWDKDYQPRETWLTSAQVDALITVLQSHRADYVRFAIATGGRHAELAAAQDGDIDRDRGVIFLRSTKTRKKGKGNRFVPISDLTERLLDGVTLPLCPWPDGNRQRDLEAACRRAGVPKVSSNDLRRTHATWLVQSGISDDVAARVLGNSPEMIRRVYGQHRPESLRDLVRETLVLHSNAKQPHQPQPTTGPQKRKTPELPGEFTNFAAGAEGLEPTTCGFGIRRPRTHPAEVAGENVGPEYGETLVLHGNLVAFDVADRFAYELLH